VRAVGQHLLDHGAQGGGVDPLGDQAAGAGRLHHVADLGPITLLDAVATSDASGRAVTLAVINRDRDRDHAATVDLAGAVATGLEVAEVNGPEVGATNSFEAPHRVSVRERRVEPGGARFTHTFPAHSVTVLRFGVTRGG
jgi:alpha-L-arabinofuranosidase